MTTVIDTWLAGGETLATLHLPDAGGETGVVISAPLGQDHIVGYRTLRHLADVVAASGLAAIRYEHPGLGDSTAPLEQGSLERGALLAATALRDAGVARVVYVGLGSGALVASAAAAADPDAAGLALWDPAPSGRQWLRRQKSLYSIAVGDDIEPGDPGMVQIVGMEFSDAFAAHVGKIDYAPETTERMPVLVAVRKGSGGAVPKALRPSLDRLDVVEITGHEAALDVSSVLATIPGDSVRTLADWLVTNFAGQDRALTAPTPVTEVRVTEDGVELTETLTRIGPHELFAVETRPVGADSDAPAVILHNGSSEHRIGAARHQVLLARRLGATGVRVLRVDRRGTGESGDVSADEASLLFSQTWVEDGDDAIAHLDLPREKIGVVGMCVGGWLGLVAHPESTRFVAALSLNDHRVRAAQPGAVVARDTSDIEAQKTTRRGRISVAFRDRVNRAVALAKKRLPYGAVVALASRGHLQFAEPNLRRALAAGTDVLLLLGPTDERIFKEHGGKRAVERLASTPGRLTVVERPTGDHALNSPGIRNEAIDLSVELAVREFGLTPANQLSKPLKYSP